MDTKTDTVFFPNSTKHFTDMESFRRLELFTNLAVKFTAKMDHGVDTSVKTLKTLLQHPPLQGMTVMNDVLDFLKETVLAYQAARLAGNEQVQGPETPNTKPEKMVKYKMFPKVILCEVRHCVKALRATVTEHATLMKKLRDAQRGYIEQHSRLKLLVEQHKATLTSQGQTLESENEQQLLDPAWIVQRTVGDKASGKAWTRILKQKEVQAKAFVRVMVLVHREQKMRDFKLTQIGSELRQIVEFRIGAVLSQGLYHLEQFRHRFGLHGDVAYMSDTTDVKHTAAQIYNEMCTKYIFPKIESYANDDLIPELKFETPDLASPTHKHGSVSASRTSGVNPEGAPSGERFEQIYVRAIETSVEREAANFLTFDTGQKLKQKLCSVNEAVAFGWQKSTPGSRKTYGFYPTRSVEPVS